MSTAFHVSPDPVLCPDAPEPSSTQTDTRLGGGTAFASGEHERCDHCPLNNLDAAQLTDTGQLLRRALDLLSALSMGVRIGLDEIDADEFVAMQVVEQERDAYDRERAKRH